MPDLPSITIYTDGGCNPNPGPGGWAAILLPPDAPPQELSGAESNTTNNRMELRAAIEALQAVPGPHQITFYTDSQYLRRGVTEWLAGWIARNWQTSSKVPVQNQDLWQQLAVALKRHQIDWRWTKGHAGDRWNERADALARAQIPRAALPLDDQQAVHIFTAAAYSGKSKRGGWAVMLRYQEHERFLNGQASNTSANRMHLQAAIEGLAALKRPLRVHLYTSADYLKDGATQWLGRWIRQGWQTKTGKPVSHRDLWQKLHQLLQTHEVHWHRLDRSDLPERQKELKQRAVSASQADSQIES